MQCSHYVLGGLYFACKDIFSGNMCDRRCISVFVCEHVTFASNLILVIVVSFFKITLFFGGKSDKKT